MKQEFVQLVNDRNVETGIMEKLLAHRTGVLHRAVSVFVFNSNGALLLQQRAAGKYHSSGLWSNTCCTHPRPGEAPIHAAIRRLREEMGLQCDLEHRFDIVYKAALDNGLIEHEYDLVFTGISDDVPAPDPDEVAAWKYLSPAAIIAQLRQQPTQFSAWFPLLFDKLRAII